MADATCFSANSERPPHALPGEMKSEVFLLGPRGSAGCAQVGRELAKLIHVGERSAQAPR
jgi:hypothetical protein